MLSLSNRDKGRPKHRATAKIEGFLRLFRHELHCPLPASGARNSTEIRRCEGDGRGWRYPLAWLIFVRDNARSQDLMAPNDLSQAPLESPRIDLPPQVQAHSDVI